MDSKTHRYMQRIQKLLSTPNRTTSPIRPPKSPFKNRANQLDQYIKYDLSAKIINNIIHKNHQTHLFYFFNMIRNTDYRQKQKIYKFVAIQRQEVKIDRGVSAKLMLAVIKQLVKSRFTNFILNLPREDQYGNYIFNSQSKQEGTQSAQLLRTSSRPDQSSYKKVTEWVDDIETIKEKQDLITKVIMFKRYTSRNILKLINQKRKRQLNFALQCLKRNKPPQIKNNRSVIQQVNLKQSKELQNQSKVSVWMQKQQKYKKQIDQLNLKLTRASYDTQRPGVGKDSNNSSKLIESTYLQSSRNQSSNVQLYKIIIIKSQRAKTKLLEQAKIILRQAYTDRIRKKQSLSKTKICAGSFILAKFENNFFRRAFDLLKSFNKLAIKNSINHNSSNISNISSISRIQSSNPITKLNFYIFVDKVFKMILIVSKLLIPLRQSFDKINQYALYSYELQQKFKNVPLNRLQVYFNKIKEYRYQQESNSSNMKLQKIFDTLNSITRQRMVESFSHIKIMAQQRKSKIKLIPIKHNIIEITKQFIDERNAYSQQSFDYWNKIRQNIYRQSNTGDAEVEKKERKVIFSSI